MAHEEEEVSISQASQLSDDPPGLDFYLSRGIVRSQDLHKTIHTVLDVFNGPKIKTKKARCAQYIYT